MYIAVLDEVHDPIVPTLVAHSILGAHLAFCNATMYLRWLNDSFRKVVVKVTRKEFNKIQTTLLCYAGHENTTLKGEKSCLVIFPVMNDDIPNVLKFAKLWRPNDSLL